MKMFRKVLEKCYRSSSEQEAIKEFEEKLKTLKESSGAKELREQLEFAEELAVKGVINKANKKLESNNGTKLDQGKLSYTLLPFKAITEVVKVLEFGKQKYAKDNWQKVPNGKERYIDAALRHIISYIGGETTDPESGLHHLAHATCCLLFAIWFDLVGKKG